MKHRFALAVAFILTASVGSGEDRDQGPGLMERGMELFLEGLRDEMSPALEDLRKLAEDYGPEMLGFLQQMGPAFGKLMDQVNDWTAYEAPEILPNGDIIIRKKPAPDLEMPDPPPAGQIDI